MAGMMLEAGALSELIGIASDAKEAERDGGVEFQESINIYSRGKHVMSN